MDPTDLDVEDARARATLRRVRKLRPGRVVSYSHVGPSGGATAVCELGVIGVAATGQRGTPRQLPSCPVLWPRFAGMTMCGRLDPGDEVMLAICDHSLDRWLLAGGPVELDSDRQHDVLDAVVLPGLCSGLIPRPILALDSMIIGREDYGSTLTLSYEEPSAAVLNATSVRLGNAAGSHGVVGGSLADAQTAIDAAVGTLAAITGVGPDGPNVEAIAGAVLAVLQALSVSTKVLVEVPAP